MKYQEQKLTGFSTPKGRNPSSFERSLPATGVEKQNKKKRTDKKKKIEKKAIGSAKGIETMFRNAYRAELDLIALAATKANIMISLNGLIASAIMISVGFLHAEAAAPLYFVPMVAFILTSCISIYFALLAASPQAAHVNKGLAAWIKDLFCGKTTLNSIKNYTKFNKDYVEEESNLLIYADRVKLSKKEYWIRMRELLSDQELIYEKMSDQLYWLGMITNTKFSMLRISYAVFRWGLVLSVLALLFIKGFEYAAPEADEYPGILSEGVVSSFKGIYEPSAIQQLPDGRLLVVEDEPSRALSIVQFRAGQFPVEDASLDHQLIQSFHQKLTDLEGLTIDQNGYIYAITSHSRNHKGNRKTSRENILRFKIKGNIATEISTFTGLVDALAELDIFKRAGKLAKGKKDSIRNINIEAMSFDKSGKRLMLGLRGPLMDGKSVILIIQNPSDIFERNTHSLLVEDPIFLDLGGGGIRSMEYLPRLNAYLIASETKAQDGKKHSQLWVWSGNKHQKPTPLVFDKTIALKNIEAIAPVTINGKNIVIIASDDGNINKDKPAHFMLMGYDVFLSGNAIGR